MAHDEERGWLLLADAGVQLRELGNPPGAWLDALPLYAELQRREAGFADDHVAHGVPSLPISTLPAGCSGLFKRGLPLEPEELARLAAFSPLFEQLGAELDAAGLPPTVQHDDLHMAGVDERDLRLRILDWGDSSISHPLPGSGRDARRRREAGSGATRFGYGRDVFGALVRRRVISNFGHLSAGDYKAVVAQLAPDVHHVFAGDSALGGERHSREAVERWFERLFRLCPQIQFEVGRVISSGPPWDIWGAAEWLGRVTPAAGDPYVNTGTHVFRIRNGRVVYFHAYEDSQKVARACEQMAALGIVEAAAAQITD